MTSNALPCVDLKCNTLPLACALWESIAVMRCNLLSCSQRWPRSRARPWRIYGLGFRVLDRGDEMRPCVLQSALVKFRGPSMGMRGYREQCRYELWTLSELMLDPYCCAEMLSHGGVQPVLKFLSADNAAGADII